MEHMNEAEATSATTIVESEILTVVRPTCVDDKVAIRTTTHGDTSVYNNTTPQHCTSCHALVTLTF